MHTLGILAARARARATAGIRETDWAPDSNGDPMPVCQQHLDDLSWVAIPNHLLSDQPGWSHE